VSIKQITKLSIAGVAIVVAIVAAVTLFSQKGRWRVETIELKLHGELPEYSWPTVLLAQIPKILKSNSSHEITGGLVTGAVRYSHRDASGPCPVVFDTPYGEIHARIVDDDLLEFLFREQVDRRVYSFEGASVEEGDVVVDGGAHLGTFTLNALRRGASKVIAFEPEPTNADCLRTTFRQEIEDGRVILSQTALWHSPATLSFSIDSGGHESARGKVSNGGTLEVEAVTLDDTVESLGLKSVDFIKLDIEGAERDALEGSRKTLQQFKPKLALCIYHREDDAEVVPATVQRIQPDYQMFKTDEQVYFYP